MWNEFLEAKETHNGMIEDCPMSTHDIHRETAIWNKLLGGLKGKETRRSPEEIKVEHVVLGDEYPDRSCIPDI